MINAQDWLNEKFPTQESREVATELELATPDEELEGVIDLSDLVNLTQLSVENQPNLTRIKGLENCPKLVDFLVSDCPNLQSPFATLKEKLVEAQQKHQNHLTQEKAQLTQEIQLIKGVLT